jgi:hypothetical protein
MGEYADLLLSGLLDEETGELIDGDAPGYPRSPTRERRHAKKRKPGPWVCKTCGKGFASEQGVNDHKRMKHS